MSTNTTKKRREKLDKWNRKKNKCMNNSCNKLWDWTTEDQEIANKKDKSDHNRHKSPIITAESNAFITVYIKAK